MPLEVGSVFVRIGGLFDKTEFDKADKAVAQQRAQAKDPINYTIGVDDRKVTAESQKARAKVKAETEHPVDIPIGANGARAIAEAAAVRKAVQAEMSKPIVSSSASSGGKLTVGHLIGGLLHAPGGPMGMGGMSLGTMIGLGPEHLLTAGGAFLGTLAPAAGGAGLLAGAAAGKEIVGGGSDALIGHTTRANAEAIYKLQQQETQAIQKLANTRDQAIKQYGPNSRDATAARRTYQQGVAAQRQTFQQGVRQQAGSGAGVQAEEQLDKKVKQLGDTYKQTSQTAQAESAKFDEQIINFAQKMLPFVIQSAQRNLKELDSDIRPLFKWLSGPQGMGIFKDLEDDFSKQMPTSIHAATQAIELVLKLIDDAAKRSGGLSKALDRFFTKENERSASSLDHTVDKLINDFHDWMKLIEAFGKVFAGVMHDSAHEGIPLVKQLTDVLDKMAKWENSAKGSAELKSFFKDRATELEAIMHSLGPLVKLFFQFYMDVQVLVPGVTKFFKILTDILNPIAKLAGHSKLFNDMFVVPMGAFLLIWKRFGWEKASGLVTGMARAMGLLSKRTSETATATENLGKKQGLLNRAAGGAARLVRRVPGAGGVASRLERFAGVGGPGETAAGGDAGGIAGATGMGRPGSKTNPIVVAEIDPQYSGMGNEAKGYTEEMEEGGAAGEAEKAASQDVIPGLERDVGGAAPQTALTGFEDAASKGIAPAGMDVAEAAAGGGILSKLGGLLKLGGGAGEGAGLLSKAGGMLGGLGGLGAIGGMIAAPIAGHLIGGRAGKAVSTIGGSAATGAGIGMMFGPEGAAVGGALGAGYGIVKNAGGVGGMLGKDASFYGGVAKDIGKAFSSAWKGVESGAKSAWKGVESGASGMWKGIKSGANGLASDVKGAWKDIKSGASTAWKDVKSDASSVWHSIVSGVEGIPGDIKGAWKDLESDASGVWKKVESDFSNAIHSIVSGVEALPGDFESLVSKIVSKVGKLPGDFLDLAKKIVSNIVNGVESLPGKLLSMGEKAGEKLLSGIESKIKSIPGDVWNKIKGAGGGILHSIEHPFGLERGGTVPGIEYGRGDQMTLIDPSGRPRARMAGDESIYTRHQRPYVDAGLKAIGFRGGSDELWNRVNTPHSHSGGGALLLYGGGRLMSFATGGKVGRQITPTGTTTNATLSRFGQGALNSIDNKVAALDTKYNTENNVFTLYAGSSGALSAKQLKELMGIREQQWDLLYKEWLELPAALQSLQKMTYGEETGSGKSKRRVGGIVTSVKDLKDDVNSLSTLVSEIGGDAKPSTVSVKMEALEKYTKNMTVAQVAATQQANQRIKQTNRTAQATNARTRARNAADQSRLGRQVGTAEGNTGTGVAYSVMDAVYKTNSQKMASLTDQLNALHTSNLHLTKQINTLLRQRNNSHGNQTKVNTQIHNLRTQRSDNNDKAVKIESQLNDLHNVNASIALQNKDDRYWEGLSKAAAETGLTGKTTQLDLTLRSLRQELDDEEKLESQAKSAISTIKQKLHGGASGGESVAQELSDYGYDMMQLLQQGASIPGKYQTEIEKVYKKLGIPLPKGWANAGQVATATNADEAFQAFQQSLTSTFGSYGSNFVSAGVNPYRTKAARMAGNTFYGATAGTTRGRETPAAPATTKAGNTSINITQHFGSPAPDPHTYSHGLKWELGNAMG